MTKTLLTLSVVALFALPAFGQPAPGAAPQEKPTVAPLPAGPGSNHGMGNPAPAMPPSQPAPGVAAAPAPTKPTTPPIYDEDADAKTDVATAVAKAKKEKKRVLVTLGANWCGWCRALDRTFTKDERVAAAIAKS
ncbi:MAG TPA: thioredoxin family protein, partial [Thermoanaerobaculia bacterium]|nr:thioredoxin family protein [Thermoanaerobaculia bacterium]